MLRSYFGLSKNPFDRTRFTLLAHQQDIFDTLGVHCQQGGFCLLLGQPGTGKSVIKSSLLECDPKRYMITPVARTLHSYSNTLRILCAAFQTDTDCLRKLRLLFEDFPKNHNLILIGLPSLVFTLNLAVNEEIKSRVTYSVSLPRLNSEQIHDFILAQLDLCGLAHRTFSPDALDLLIPELLRLVP